MDRPQPDPIFRALQKLTAEVVDGAGADSGWLLNPADPGLLRSLDRLTAEQASALPSGRGASVAAHTDHLRYGLELLNRWSEGHDPFGAADYGASWKRLTVSDSEWARLREQLRDEARTWQETIPRLASLGDAGLTGALASVAHLAYHLGAIRQANRATRGPAAQD